MWPGAYRDRLQCWHALRQQCQNQPTAQCLQTINQWWMGTPWCAYRLHWDDHDIWPDPWQLLEEKQFCSLARGLGIMYTISLLERKDIQDATLVEVENGNLVEVCNQKYILNWDKDLLLSNQVRRTRTPHCITQKQLQEQLR
jgi:hypothetical protein